MRNGRFVQRRVCKLGHETEVWQRMISIRSCSQVVVECDMLGGGNQRGAMYI